MLAIASLSPVEAGKGLKRGIKKRSSQPGQYSKAKGPVNAIQGARKMSLMQKTLAEQHSRGYTPMAMKTDLHPTYFKEAKVVCACGATFTVGATREKIEVDICSNCHPFYTGESKLIDTAGRVEKFKTRRAKAVTEPKPTKVRVKKAAKKE